MRNELYQTMEEDALDLLNQARNLPEGSKERDILHKQAMDIIDRVHQVDEGDNEAYDKEQRRIIEKQKNDDAAEAEKRKSKWDLPRLILEGIGKVGIPLVFGVAIFLDTRQARKEAYEFEEKGTVTSSQGRKDTSGNGLNFLRKFM